MADSWYLLGNSTGTDQLPDDDFPNGGFQEILNSEMAYDIEVCNYDLSVCTPARAVIEHKQQDTELQTIQRLCYTEIGTCKAGNYVKYKNRYWLIVGLVDDNTLYEKSVILLCNYKLTWMDASGKIHQRWSPMESATQYNNGEAALKNYVRRTDKIFCRLPPDEATMLIPHNARFIVDRRTEIYDKRIPEGTEFWGDAVLQVYRQTRQDNTLYNYNSGQGYLAIILYLDEQKKNDGRYLIDGKTYWLCDPYSKGLDDQPETGRRAVIEYETEVLFNGLEYVEFKAHFYDGDDALALTPVWEVSGDSGLLITETEGNSLFARSNSEELVGRSITLTLQDADETCEQSRIVLTVTDFI